MYCQSVVSDTFTSSTSSTASSILLHFYSFLFNLSSTTPGKLCKCCQSLLPKLTRIDRHTLYNTLLCSLAFLNHLTCKTCQCGRKPEHLEEIHSNKQQQAYLNSGKYEYWSLKNGPLLTHCSNAYVKEMASYSTTTAEVQS